MRPVRPAERAALLQAAREFNSARYFEAHEFLEEALEEDVADEHWNLFLGLIQVCVGYHKIQQGLWSGAERMLRIGLEKLEGLPGRFGDMELDGIRARATADQRALAERRFDREAFEGNPPRLQPLPSRPRGPNGRR